MNSGNDIFLKDKIFKIISQTAKEHGVRAFVIGGFVRDCFLQRPRNDIDVVVEGSGIALAEAMYCGSVPVTFTIEGSGVNWVSVGGETGIEVPLGDVKAYAEAIDRLLSDRDLYMKYATAGKDRVVRMFTSERANAQAEEVLTRFAD